MSALQPPPLNTQQAAAASPDGSDASDDHYSSASEGQSPIPITRVERIDDNPHHGEVPNTPAYNLRLQDAVPDEMEIVPEGQRSRSNTTQSRGRGLSGASFGVGEASGGRSPTPGGSPIPKTVVEKVDFTPRHGEVEGTPAKEMRMADAIPDEIRKAPEHDPTLARSDGRHARESVDDGEEDDEGRQRWFRNMWEAGDLRAGDGTIVHAPVEDEGGGEPNDDDDDFGDDFDEFAEGEELEGFGDFDEGLPEEPSEAAPAIAVAPDIFGGLPPLDLSTCTTPAEIEEAITPYINALLPDSQPIASPKSDLPTLDASDFPAFQSERSLSLWQQLVSPPPMQPPNWTRSRIRRLFLVSLGVPVDLDELLPPSKQKRLVLPSIGLDDDGTARPTSAIERLREQNTNDSSTSLDSKTGVPKPSKHKRNATAANKGPPPPPEFDLNAVSLLCSTTEEALSVYSDAELKDHVFTLQMLNGKASGVLEYWLQRKDESLKEKEALEGVIENLVGFVKGRRGR